MSAPDEFDAFYKDARTRLLLQTYALTGDLPASRSAVRDAFIAAWHHWRKVSRRTDPEGWVRPHAWAHAQRRHTARIWHRDKSLDPETRSTLEALGKLPIVQRKALLLTHLTTLSLADMAREIGLPRPEAERQLQTATAQFAVHRDVPTTNLRPLFDPLREHAEQARWPRPTILRRAGAARRRTHSLVGVGLAVAALVGSGSLVTDVAGARPTLAGDRAPGRASAPSTTPASPEPPPEEFSADHLLTVDQVGDHVAGRRWSVGSTTDNTQGNGVVLPCQQTRFADPKGVAALVRTFSTSPRRREAAAHVAQVTELSESERRARRAFETTLGWYAGCAEPRVQLISTRKVEGVGDDASLLVLRAWKAPGWTYVAGMARTGRITTLTLTRTTGPAEVGGSARLLAEAVSGLCGQPDAGACVTRPSLETATPVPVGQVPGMLVEVDLPPVDGVARPWVGTEPRKALLNVAATNCDNADFNQRPISNNLTRSFVIPGARLPDAFGLTQTVGTLPAARARSFVAQVRKRMAACPDKDLGTEVSRVAHQDSREKDLSVWHVRTEISDRETVSFLMGIVRTGTAVAQVGFVPDDKVTMAPGEFIALVRRAAARLPAMPPPR